MASTPPLRIISVQEPPPTPRHGPAHDDFEPRYLTRSSQKAASYGAKTTPEAPSRPRALRSATTPDSRRSIVPQSRHHLSPPTSPPNSPKHTSAKRMQVPSPNSPGTRTGLSDASSSNPSFTSLNHPQRSLTDTSITVDGMLPTPVKTPRKKALPDVHAAARVLFQELPHSSDEIMPSPKKNRRSKRHSGFSLETFATESGVGSGPVQIFTDSRDNVPQLDLSEENPFNGHTAAEAGSAATRVVSGSKRRRLKADRKADTQVEEAIKNDEGLVYVFRGKKVFKRFDDGSDEEQAIVDPDDLGLLKHTEVDSNALQLFNPLTRRSIRPKRLFQTEEQKRAREAEKAEEEVTDIEEEPSIDATEPSVPVSGSSNNSRRSRRITSTKSDPTANGHALDEVEDRESGANDDGGSPVVEKAKKAKRGSPFDSWKRVKPGTSTSTVGHSKGRKRASSDLEDAAESNKGKKLRNR